MRIVNPPPATTRRWPFDSRSDAASLAQDRRIAGGHAQGRVARFERLGLTVTSLVLVFGLWLTYVEQTTTFSTFEADVRNGALVNLSSVRDEDRKSTRLNSSHSQISYAVFCLKKKKK